MEIQGFLTSIENDWLDRGWNLDSLHSFRMEVQESTDTPGTLEAPETPVETQTETPQGTDYSGYSEFVQGLLKEAPDEHKTLLEPYLKKWDAGVSRRFQELQGQLKPYQDFGDVETIQQAVELYHMLEDDDEARKVYESLHSYFNTGQQVTPTGAPQVEVDTEFQELPPEFLQKFQQQEQIIQALAQHYLGEQEAQQAAQEDAALDQTMKQLTAEFGEFDEEYVLAKMYAGADPVEAVQAYQAMMQQRLSAYQQTQRTPPTLSGGGSVPVESQNLAKVPRNDLKKFVAGLLEQQAQGQ